MAKISVRLTMKTAVCLSVIQLILFNFILNLRADSNNDELPSLGPPRPRPRVHAPGVGVPRDDGIDTHFRNYDDDGLGILVLNDDNLGHGHGHDDAEVDDYGEQLDMGPRPRERRQAEPDANGPTTTTKRPLIDPTKYLTTGNDLNIPPGYNIYQLPKDPVHGGSLPMFIYIRVKKVLDWDELNEVIVLDMEFQVLWTDFLIMYNNNRTRNSTEEFVTAETLSEAEVKSKRRTLNNPYILDKIWKPNLFIEHLLAVQQPNLLARPITIKFIPEVGWFEYITRFSIKLSCEMNFHYYPADTQEYDFALRGFAYNKSDLDLNWYKNGVFMEQVEMQSYDLQLTNRRKYEWMKNNDTNDIFAVLAFKILARRRLNYHLVQTYLSSSFYMIITCLCFLFPPRMIEAKIGMSMTALLTLTSMFASIRASTPVVSYIKAIDIWMVCCIFFVFLTLCQYTLSTWLRTQVENAQLEQHHHEGYSPGTLRPHVHPNAMFMTKAEKEMQIQNGSKGHNSQTMNGLNGHFRVSGGPHQQQPHSVGLGAPKGRHKRTLSAEYRHQERMKRFHGIVTWMEKYSFVAFLGLFVIGNVVYWTVLLVRADYFDWKVNRTLNNVEVDA